MDRQTGVGISASTGTHGAYKQVLVDLAGPGQQQEPAALLPGHTLRIQVHILELTPGSTSARHWKSTYAAEHIT